MSTTPTYEFTVIGSEDDDGDGVPCLTVMRMDDDAEGTVQLWIEDEDGDGSCEMTREQFDKFVEGTRKLMGWV